jgi:hypothetical protein
MGPHRLSRPNDGTKVVGIGDPIEGKQQGGLTKLGATLNEGTEIQGVCSGGLERNALVHRASCDLGKPRPGDFFHQHTRCLGFPEQLEKFGSTAHLWRAPNPVNRAT